MIIGDLPVSGAVICSEADDGALAAGDVNIRGHPERAMQVHTSDDQGSKPLKSR
jgi:hypothetical protein